MNSALKTSTAVSQCRMRVRTGYRAGAVTAQPHRPCTTDGDLRFTGPGPIRRRVHGRSGAQQRIVGRLDSVGQHQGIEVDIAGVSRPFCLDTRQGEHSGVDGATVGSATAVWRRAAGSPGLPIVSFNRHCSGPLRIWRTSASNSALLCAASRRLGRLQRDERPPNRACALRPR